MMGRMGAFWAIFAAILAINLMGSVIKVGVEVFLETILLLALLPLVVRIGGKGGEKKPGLLSRLLSGWRKSHQLPPEPKWQKWTATTTEFHRPPKEKRRGF